ncbi:MAG: hypothetical protein U1E42_00820 [Rhodospirillales bacterium]
MSAFLTAWRWPLLLTGLCVALAVVLAGLVDAPSPPSAESAAQDSGPVDDDAMADRSFELDPITSFREVAERPLFSRSRRPAPPDRGAAADARSGGSGAPFVLSGVIVAGTTRVAFLQPRSQPKTLRVLEGETVEGWKIEKIQPFRVVIGNGDAREELTLQDRIAPSGAAAAAPADGRQSPRTGRRMPPQPPGRDGMMPGQPFRGGDPVDGATEETDQQ